MTRYLTALALDDQERVIWSLPALTDCKAGAAGGRVRRTGPRNRNRRSQPVVLGFAVRNHHIQSVDGATGQLTVTLRDRADVALWSTTLDPKAG